MKTREIDGYDIVDLHEEGHMSMCRELNRAVRLLCLRPAGHDGEHVACTIDLDGDPIRIEAVWGGEAPPESGTRAKS